MQAGLSPARPDGMSFGIASDNFAQIDTARKSAAYRSRDRAPAATRCRYGVWLFAAKAERVAPLCPEAYAFKIRGKFQVHGFLSRRVLTCAMSERTILPFTAIPRALRVFMIPPNNTLADMADNPVEQITGDGSAHYERGKMTPFKLEGYLDRMRCSCLIVHGRHDVLRVPAARKTYDSATERGFDVALRIIDPDDTDAEHCQYDDPTIGQKVLCNWVTDHFGIDQAALLDPAYNPLI
jgi:hypothetical protein